MHLLRRLFLATSVGLLVAAAVVVPLPFFLESPGQPLGLVERVTVAAPGTEAVEGDYLLTTVLLRRSSLVGLLRGVVDDNLTVVPAAQLIPPGVGDEDYFERQERVFDTTAQLAAAVALDAAGFPVDPASLTGEGAVVLRVLSGSPAEGVLAPGDVVTSAGGQPVGTAEQLREIASSADGSLRVTFERGGQVRSAELTPRRLADVPQPVIGVEVETLNPSIDLPVPVEVDTGRIGGPSAGLMIALTVYDKVAAGDLAARRLIAGTGGITTDGRVTPIGGIAQKVLSAARADLDVFLAPAGQLQAACSGVPAGSRLVVLAVTDFAQAVDALAGDHSVPTCTVDG